MRDTGFLDVVEGKRRWFVWEGDALEALRLVPDNAIGALVTDPPYSTGGMMRGDRTVSTNEKYSKAVDQVQADFSGDNRDQRSFEYWCVLWLAEARRAAIAGAPIVQFTDWRQLPTTTDALQAGGWVWRGLGVWSKGDACRPQMGRFRNGAEYFVWGTNGPSLDLESVGCLPGVMECYAPPTSERVHLTQKPERIMEWVVSIAPPNSLIVDPFCGSGTTGIAALRKGHRFLGFELSPHYSKTARERLEAEERGLTLQAARSGQTSIFDAMARECVSCGYSPCLCDQA